MIDPTDPLWQLSTAIAERAASMRGAVAAIRIAEERHRTGMLWQPDLVVASEQSLPRREAFEVAIAGRAPIAANVVGRDRGTNVALLQLPEPVPLAPRIAGNAPAGTLALAFGADEAAEVTVRVGVVNFVGPPWHSHAGGRIDARIALDMRIARSEEGGPVLDAAGACLGMTTLGPAAQVLVIPVATLERIVPMLLKEGRVSRGWLGVALQPVAVPDALQSQAGQASGLMVMSIADASPAAKAGIVAGDIVVTVNGTPARRLRGVATHLGAESIGREADLRVIRGGTILSLKATIEARPAA
ncbi:MAG TPA: S1C family serine protease [Casimicrobiaceae bacterium]